jgi:hypothetical protein
VDPVSQKEDTTARGSGQVPTLTFDFTVEQIGYQLDIYLNGKVAQIEFRDFSGAPGPKHATEKLLREIEKAVDRWRSSL